MNDIFFLGPHDITRYFGFWYDNHTILHDISHLVKYARKLQELRHFSEICEKTVQYTENHSLNVQQMHKLLKFMLLYVRP